MYTVKQLSFFIFLYYGLIFACSPLAGMDAEEDLEQSTHKTLASSLAFPQLKLTDQEDQEKLDGYIINLLQHNIKAEKTLFPDEKKVKLSLRSTSWVLSLLSKNYIPAFEMLPYLQTLSLSLDLSHKALDLEELKSAVNLATRNPSLVQLLSKNSMYWCREEKERTICLLEAMTLRNALKRGLVTNFRYSFSSCSTTPEAESAILEGLENAHSIKNLNISFFRGGERVIQSIKYNSFIESLDFSFSRKLSSDELSDLAFFITHSSSLKSLNLRYSLDDVLLFSLANVLKHTPLSLQELNLTSNWEELIQQLSEKSVKSFFDGLGINKSLRLLRLGFSLSLQHIQALADALKLNTTLKILALSGNNIGDGRLSHLAEGLKENTSITEIDLSSANISDKGADTLLELLKINTTLKILYLWGNTIDELKKEKINNILRERSAFSS